MTSPKRERTRWPGIYRLPSGRFEAHTRFGGRGGTHITRTFATATAARAWREETLADVSRGDWIEPAKGTVTLGDWWERWSATRVRLRPSTLAQHATYWGSLIAPAFGDRRLGDIGWLDVQQWVSELTSQTSRQRRDVGVPPRPLAPATVRKAHQILSAMLGGAVRAGLIRANPAVDVDLPAVDDDEMRTISAEVLERLAAWTGGQWQSLILVAGYGGLRFGELVGLDVGDVDIIGRRISVRRTVVEVDGRQHVGPPKTRHGARTVHLIPRRVFGALARLIGDRAVGPVWVDSDGGRIRRHNFYGRVWRPAIAAVGLDGLRIHDLRHSAVTLWLDAGVDPRVIKAESGTSTVAFVLQRYGHVGERLDRFIAGVDAIADRAAASANATAQIIPITHSRHTPDLANARCDPPATRSD